MDHSDPTFVIGADGARYYSAADGFLGLDAGDAQDPAKAGIVVIPFGLEASVSYGGGTSRGPAAMISASHEVELYDLLYRREPHLDYGVATRAPVDIPEGDVPRALDLLAGEVEAVMASGRIPAVFGGEHSITPGAIRPAVARWPDLALLHFDAHADLRDGYDGEHFSHAAAIRRCLDFPGVTVTSFGIRNVSGPEVDWYEQNRDRVQIAWAHDKRRWDIERLVAPLAGKTVWITFDLDGFDASLMPATGTPEPGGLFWDDAMDVLRAASRVWGRVVGLDVNELAPIDGFHASDFLAAKLAYRMMSLAVLGPGAL